MKKSDFFVFTFSKGKIFIVLGKNQMKKGGKLLPLCKNYVRLNGNKKRKRRVIFLRIKNKFVFLQR